MKAGRPSLWRAYRVPALLACLSLIGLVGALIGDGLLDLLSWVLLGALVVLIAAFVRR